MEATPRMDTSRPSNLRLAAFALTAFGALVIGVGSILTWVTVGFANLGAISSASRGTDLRDGKITLACAVVTLILVLASRLVSDTARAVIAGIVVVAGALAAGLAGWFIRSAPTNYPPIDSEAIVANLAAQYGKAPDEIRATLASQVGQLGGYTHVGAGPWVTLIGGLMVVVGGVLTVRWAARLSAAHVAADAADTDDGGNEQAPAEPSLD
jgi:Tryptophan-associated transmembrane protein (Trp_oprn_chp)